MKKETNKMLKGYKFIDLFAGLGGFRLALESMGAKCVFSSEIDADVAKTYRDNFGSLPHGDITKIDAKTIPNHDILCAGFPCQPFSISGKQKGFEDSRGTMFFEISRIVMEKKPKVLLLENVKNFEKHDKGRTMKIVKEIIDNLGYKLFWKVLNAADFGVPQNRERIYLVAFRNDLGVNDFEFPKEIDKQVSVNDVLITKGNKNLNKVNSVDAEQIIFNARDPKKSTKKIIRLGKINKGGQGERIYDPKGLAITLSSGGGGFFAKTGGYLIKGKARQLYVREAARLMGFPETYIFPAKPHLAYKQLGNSVVIDVLQFILESIAKIIKNR